MATLRPSLGASKSAPISSSPKPVSISPSSTSGHASPKSPNTTATSTAAAAIPSDEEVEAVIKQATSTQPRPDGRPPPGKDTRTQLFTGNLPYRVRWQDLKDLFRRAGTVLRADVSLTPDNRSRGYGTVLLASAEDAGRAVDMFNGYNWQGRVLEVRLDRLGAVHGPDAEAGPAAMVPSVGIQSLQLGAVNGLSPNLGALSGLHVPSPHPALPLVSQQLSGNGTSSMLLPGSTTLVSASQNSSPLNTLNPSLIALQQQQQVRQGKDKEELLTNQSVPAGGLDSFLSTIGRGGLGAELDRDQSRSNLGMRCLFVGNLPFHCQWQDLKDLFRQAGTILRADVSLGPDGRSRGFGTVMFANEIDAERAVAMFNGFEYSGRILKVHYDKYSSPLPLSTALSPNPSTLATPVLSSTSSTQAALLQAVQLQHLVGEKSIDRFTDMGSLNTSTQIRSQGNEAGMSVQTPVQSLSADLLETFPSQSQSRPTTSSGFGFEQPRTRVSSTASEASVSPFSIHLPGTSPSLAERRQKVPPPIGTGSSSTSRPGSNSGLSAGANAEGRNDITSLLGATASNVSSTSPVSPTRIKRPGGQSLPGSSASVPLVPSGPSLSLDSQRPFSSSMPPVQNTADSSTSSAIKKAEPPASDQSNAANSTSPRSSHPAHPGPISLPPPMPVSSFPLYSPHHHPMSPPAHPASPPVYAGYQSYGPMSPIHPYPIPPHMHPSNMTPHGLPPITPSMPSFSFVPQPSPSIPVGGSSAIPPTPSEGGGAPPSDAYPSPGQLTDSTGNPMGRGMGMMPMSPPMHIPHHVFQPFTPGTVLSPGAFYGRPNDGPPRGSHLNPAVGSPVMVRPSYGYPAHPGSQPGSPYFFQNSNGVPYGQEPSGYFPPVGPNSQLRHEGYFPPVSALGSSGLANEILRDGSSMNTEENASGERPVHERNDSGNGSAQSSSENALSEAERARSSSSGATSWRSEENAGSTDDTSKAGKDDTSLKGLAQDMASVRLGSPPKPQNAKYAEALKSNLQRAESEQVSVEDNSSGVPTVRHSSFGQDSSSSHPGSRRTQSAESSAQVRLGA